MVVLIIVYAAVSPLIIISWPSRCLSWRKGWHWSCGTHSSRHSKYSSGPSSSLLTNRSLCSSESNNPVFPALSRPPWHWKIKDFFVFTMTSLKLNSKSNAEPWLCLAADSQCTLHVTHEGSQLGQQCEALRGGGELQLPVFLLQDLERSTLLLRDANLFTKKKI